MTPTQFDALAQLLRIQAGASQDAARLVLVHGHQQAEVAALTGLSRAGVNNAVARMRRGLELAGIAAGSPA